MDRPADWLKQRAASVRGLLSRAMGATTLSAIALCVQAAILAHGLHAAMFLHRPWRTLLPWALLFVGLAALRFGLGLIARHYGFRAGRQQVAEMRASLLGHVQALGPSWLARESSGVWVTRLVDGVEALEGYYARYLPQRVSASVLPVVVLFAVMPADWLAGTMLLLTAPLVPVFMILLGNAAERASQRRWTVLTRLGARFHDLLQGLVTLRLFGAGERAKQMLELGSENYRQGTMAVLRVAFLSSLVLEFFATVSIAVVAVLVGFRLLWGEQVFSHGMFVLLLAPEFYLPLRGLGALRHVRMDALAIAADASELLALPLDGLSDKPIPATPLSLTSLTLTPSNPAVALHDVSFAYTDGRGALQSLTMDFPAGCTTAIVGPSGAGKSTLLNVLLGLLRPQQGTLSVNGRDLDMSDIAAWQQHISWVPQRPSLFTGTLRENILLAAPQAESAALSRAAQLAGLDPVIARLPQGWDTLLGEHGYGLSGGEAQRVALARALLRDAPLFILDEPTQQLDDDSSAIIQSVLADLSASGRTIIQVAHRMALAQRADQVRVLDAGRLVESGTPSELAARDGLYAHLLAADGIDANASPEASREFERVMRKINTEVR